MNALILESERLILKPLGLSFLSQEYVNWMNDSDVNEFLSSGGDYSLDKLKVFLTEVEKKDILFWAITTKNESRHIGNIKIDPVEIKHGICEYGIMMGDKTQWGKGFAKEASKLVIDFCFKNLNLRKMNLGVVESNTKAVRLYEKLNFVIEGQLINHISLNGGFVNVLRMALFNQHYVIK
jgi:[ribosomal protein S5]-alanine N-acetyltransferase